MRSDRTIRLLILRMLRIPRLPIRWWRVTFWRYLSMTGIWRILVLGDHSTTVFRPSQWILKGMRIHFTSKLRIRNVVKKPSKTLRHLRWNIAYGLRAIHREMTRIATIEAWLRRCFSRALSMGRVDLCLA